VDTDDRDLTEATVTGLAWTAGNRIGQQACLVVGTAVLARMLSPTDFGLVAMTAIFLGFIAVISDFGLPAALVQRRELTQVQLSSAFWLSLAIGLGLGVLLALAAPLLAALYDQDELLKITPVLALALPIGALSAVQAGRAQRAMAFRRFAFVENLALGLAYAAAIVAAALGAGVWSLVVLSVSRAAIQTAAFWIADPWRPTREYSRDAVRSLMRFGGNLAGATSIAYWINNADNLLVGVFTGGRSLGIYSRAFTLMQAPLAQVSWAAERVMFPALTRMRDDVGRMRRVYLRAISLIAFVAFPLAVVAAVAAEPIVLTLLGPDWTDAVPILRILAIGGMLQAVATTGSWIFLARGRTDWMLRWNLVSGPVTIGAFAIGVHWGATGVAWAFLIRTILIAPPALAIPGRLIGLSIWAVGRAVVVTVGMCAVTAAALVLANQVFDSAPALVWLLGDLAVAAVVYVGLAAALHLRVWRELRELVGVVVHRRERLATT
jgi:PST family polysaccharide transporter